MLLFLALPFIKPHGTGDIHRKQNSVTRLLKVQLFRHSKDNIIGMTVLRKNQDDLFQRLYSHCKGKLLFFDA